MKINNSNTISMTIKGKIKQIGQVQSFNSGLTIRECLVTTEDKYPQDIMIKFFKDKCSLLDKYKVNDTIEVSYNIRGNSYNDKSGNTRYTTEIIGWNIVKAETSNADQQPDREDDLPFF